MSFDQLVEATHQLALSNAVEMVLQQKGSILRPYVMEKACSGEAVPASDLIGTVNARRGGTGRTRENIDNKAGIDRRWLVWREEIETGELLDKRDKWLTAMDPTSERIMTHTTAIGRAIDQVILGVDENGVVSEGGLLGTATSGKRMSATTALPAANTIAAAAAGMTMDKLKEVREKLALANHDMRMSRPVIAMTARQITDMFGMIYNGTTTLNPLEQKQLVEGEVSRILGMDIVEFQALPKSGSNRLCPVWIREYVVLGVWQDVQSRMWNDSSKKNTPAFAIDCSMDCVRKQDDGVFVIEAAEA